MCGKFRAVARFGADTMEFSYDKIKKEAADAMEELLDAAGLREGNLVAVGCSSSEIAGCRIGHGSLPDAAAAVADGIMPLLRERGLLLAAQCCEHLNRALIVERKTAERFNYEIVCVIPKPKAGGSFATAVWERMDDPVAVEHVKADAGLDIGDTLIGMHLKDVAVPLRLETKSVGEAHVTSARTRPRLIGGIRAVYPEKI